MEELDGIVLHLAEIYFDDKKIGLISEDGVEWGGTDPEFSEVTAAQTRSVVKRALRKAGTDIWRFRLIELKTENMVDVAGGTASDGKWSAPIVAQGKEGSMKIETVTGQVVEAAKAFLTAHHRGTIGGDDPLGVECEAVILRDGVSSPYSIDNKDTTG